MKKIFGQFRKCGATMRGFLIQAMDTVLRSWKTLKSTSFVTPRHPNNNEIISDIAAGVLMAVIFWLMIVMILVM